MENIVDSNKQRFMAYHESADLLIDKVLIQTLPRRYMSNADLYI